MSGTTTHDNPGANQQRRARGPRQIVGSLVRGLRRGAYREATVGLFVDATNLIEERAGGLLAPRFVCNCCGTGAHAFRHLFVPERGIAWNSACPRCDSRSRHRGLAALLPAVIEEARPRRALHFAPESVLSRCFDVPGLVYETADLYLQDVTHRGIALEQLPFSNGSYDLVICNHVLEHLPDDRPAIDELRRILSPRGVLVLTVPGDFDRPETLHFTGQLVNGHYRDYGHDLIARLGDSFDVEVRDLHDFDRDPSGHSRGIRRRDLAFLCRTRTRP